MPSKAMNQKGPPVNHQENTKPTGQDLEFTV